MDLFLLQRIGETGADLEKVNLHASSWCDNGTDRPFSLSC